MSFEEDQMFLYHKLNKFLYWGSAGFEMEFVVYTSPIDIYNITEAFEDDDVALQCLNSSKAGNVSEFDALLFNN